MTREEFRILFSQDELRELADLRKRIKELEGKMDDFNNAAAAAKTEAHHWEEIAIDRENEREELREELIFIKSGIKDALDLVNGRYTEWGDRAIMAFKVLEGLIDPEGEEE